MSNQTKLRELKSQARALMMGKHGFLALATFLVSMFYLAASYLLNSVFPAVGGVMNLALGLAGSLLINILYYLFCAGQAALYLHLCRGRELRLGQLTAPFSRHPESIAVFAAVQFVIQTAFVNLALWLLSRTVGTGARAGQIPTYVGFFLLLLFVVWLELGLSMVFYLYCDDPAKPGSQLIRESLRLMRGNRGRFFCLMLSFVGVMLLGTFSAGIGMLFALPYVNTAQALFYLSIKEG